MHSSNDRFSIENWYTFLETIIESIQYRSGRREYQLFSLTFLKRISIGSKENKINTCKITEQASMKLVQRIKASQKMKYLFVCIYLFQFLVGTEYLIKCGHMLSLFQKIIWISLLKLHIIYY